MDMRQTVHPGVLLAHAWREGWAVPDSAEVCEGSEGGIGEGGSGLYQVLQPQQTPLS